MSINVNSYNTMRLTGMYSGLDTDALVSNMLATQQAKVDKVWQQTEKLKWKQDAYTQLNTSASELKDKYFSILGEKSLKKSAAFNTFKVTASDESAIEITSNPNTVQTNFNILNMKQARGARANSDNFDVQIYRTDTLSDMFQKLGRVTGDILNVDINGKKFSFSAADTTVQEFVNKINEGQDTATISFSEMTNSFSISSNELGDESTLSFSGLESFGLFADDIQAGNDAELTVQFSGQDPYTIKQNSNEFTLDDLTFNIKADYDGEEAIRVGVERDYQHSIDLVKSFIEDYNKLIENLSTKYYEQSYRDYAPLTDAQKDELTEKEIELWEEKAKSGLLRNDNAVNNLLTGLRATLGEKVGDTGMSAFDVGISTIAWSSTDWRKNQGKLQLDEDKLLAALKENPDAVQQVFAKIEDGDSESNGFIVRMEEQVTKFNSVMRQQGVFTKNSISANDKKYFDLMDALHQKEEKLYAQYAKLETMMAELQSQSNWFAAQMGMAI